MLARQLIGDVMMEFIIAVPTAAFLQPEASSPHRHGAGTQAPKQPMPALATAADRQVGLYR